MIAMARAGTYPILAWIRLGVPRPDPARKSGLERPRIRGDVDCVFPESIERNDVERSFMRGCKDDEGCRTVYVRP